MFTGEKIEPGRAVFIDGTTHLPHLIWLPDATATLRVFWGISKRGHVADPRTQVLVSRGREAGSVEVVTDGTPYDHDDHTGIFRVHAASNGDRSRNGMFTSLPASSEVGHEIIELPAGKVTFRELSGKTAGVWRVSVA